MSKHDPKEERRKLLSLRKKNKSLKKGKAAKGKKKKGKKKLFGKKKGK